MPGLISVPEFVRETKEDYSSPTTSTFVSKIPLCRETIAKHEEVCFFSSSWVDTGLKGGTF